MQRLSRLTLFFAIAFAVLIISPAFLNRQFGLYPLILILLIIWGIRFGGFPQFSELGIIE